MKTRTERHTHMVDTTIAGETRPTPQTYTVTVPVPPRDWDRLILRGVTGLAIGATGIAVVWSTASIGDLLARVVHPVIAYGAAGVFDAAWIACVAIEWLERYDKSRATVARRVGWVALAVAMAAVVAHGHVAGNEYWAGGVGAFVSAIAKTLWVVVHRHYTVPMGEQVESWLSQRRSEVAAQCALSGQLRRLDEHQKYTTAVYGTTAQEAWQLTAAPGTTTPGALAEPRPDTSPDTEAPAPAPSPAEPSETTPENGSPPPTPLSGQSIAATIRTLIASGITDKERVIDLAARLHSGRPQDTIRRTYDRVTRRSA